MTSPAPPHRPARRWRAALVVPPLLLGLGLLGYQLRADRGPEAPQVVERVTPVDVFVVEPTTVVPRAVGYGTVAPARTYRATAEIAGRVTARHPRLERGRLLPAGTLIAEIDRADYELALARAAAEIARLEAQIAQLEVRRANLERSLEIDLRTQRLAEADRERQRALAARGNTSEAAVDQAETALLNQRYQVQSIRSELAEIDPEIAVRQADLDVRRAELRQAELDLERTEVYLPFDARVADVAVEAGEYVQPGTVLGTFDGIDGAEVDAQFALSQLRPLIPDDLELPALDLETLRSLPERLGLEATVRLEERDLDLTWPARFDRPSDRIDPQTRTLGLIVAVAEPYALARPGERPPLTKGMFVEVLIEGRPQPGRLVVPIDAVHARGPHPKVHLVGANDRLVLREIVIDSVMGDVAVIARGLEAGDRVVLTPLQPAVEGMRLEPREPAPATEPTTVSEAAS